jgi:hypothetical protein
LFSAREIVSFTKEKGSKQLIVKEGFRTEVGSTGNVEMMRSEYPACVGGEMTWTDVMYPPQWREEGGNDSQHQRGREIKDWVNCRRMDVER